MTKNIQQLLTVENFAPEEVLSPASVTGRDRVALTQALEAHGNDRLTIERGRDYQTLRKNHDGWLLTCRSSRY